jgi:RHS repeat-associated protein
MRSLVRFVLVAAIAAMVVVIVSGSASGIACPETSTGGFCGGGGSTLVTAVSVTAPNAGTTVSGTVTLKASVSTSTGGGCGAICPGGATTSATTSSSSSPVVVEFYVDGVIVGSTSSSPYSVSWNSLDPNQPFYDGPHSVTAWAYAANALESSPVSITLANTAKSQYQATFNSTAVPQSMLDGSAGTTYPVDVTVKNTSTSAWSASYVTLHYEWFSPDPTPVVTDGGALSVGSLAAGAQTTVHAVVTPPTLASGIERADYKLRFDLYDSRAAVWFSAMGNLPLDNPVIVNKSLTTALGLERYYHYLANPVGEGMDQLVNVANGNSLLRWTPFDEPGRGLATVADITYNSLEKKSDSPLGNNFSLSLSTLSRFGLPIDIHPNKADQIAGRATRWVSFIDGDGTPHRFDGHVAADGSVYWTDPAGLHLYLHQVSTDVSAARYWAITRPDGVTFYYDANGFPTSVADRNGNTITYTESTPASPADDPGKLNKLITAVTDAGGRAFTITYYTKDTAPKAQIRGKIQSIVDHAGGELDFNYYYDGNLRQIVQKGGLTPGGGFVGDRSFTFTYTTSDGSGPAITDPAARRSPDPSTANESTRLYSVIDPRGNETTFTYVTSGQDKWKLASSTDRAGSTTTYSYDDTNQVTTASLPLGRAWKYAYNAGGQATAITNPLGQKTTIAWSPDLEVSSIVEPSGATTSYAYNDNGYLTSSTDAVNNKTQLTYENLAVDSSDVAAKWSPGRTIPHESQLSTKTEPLGVAAGSGYQWKYSYDGNGNLRSVTDPVGNVTTNTYNADGTLASTSDADAHPPTLFQNYDANGLPRTITDPLGNKTTLTYDAAGRITAVQDPAHSSFGQDATSEDQYVYDAFGREARESTPKSTSSEPGTLVWTDYSYDANDNVTAVTNPHYGTQTDPTGAPTTTYTYDPMDRLTQIATPDPSDNPDPAGARTQNTYDAAGRLIKQVAPLGLVAGAVGNSYTTTFDYDALDRLLTTTHYPADGSTAGARITHQCYDLAGDLRSATLPRGAATFTGCPAATTPYVVSSNPFTWTYAYDAAHNLLSQSDPLHHTQSVTYDANGNVKTSTDENGTTTTYSYDQRDLLTQTTQPFDTGVSPARNVVAKYEYDGVGNLTRQISPRGYDASPDKVTFAKYLATYHYNADNELVRTDLPTDATTAASYQYTCYDVDGRIAAQSLPVSLVMDPTAVDCSRLDGTQKTTVDYFDPGWIRTLDDPADPPLHYQYTAEGWQTDRLPDNAAGQHDPGHEQQWVYDALGLVTKIIDPPNAQSTNPTSTFSYDTNGQLIKTTESGVYDNTSGDAPLAVTVGYDGFGEQTRVASQKTSDTSGNWNVTRFAYDADGNVGTRIDNQLEDGSGNVVTPGKSQTFTYDGADWMQTEVDQSVSRRITESFFPTGWEQSRLVEKQSAGTWVPKQKTTWTYYANGLLKSLQTVNGSNVTLESHSESYIDANNVFVNGNVVDDHFSLAGANSVCTVAAPCDASYGYDAQDRVTSYKDGHGDSSTYALDPSGDVTAFKTTDSTGLTSEQDYTYHGTQLATQTKPDGTVVARYWYTDLGELLCVTNQLGAKSDCPAKRVSALGPNVLESYVYDPLRRLSDVQSSGATTPIPLDTHYTYDALDRVTQEAEKPSQFNRTTKLNYLGLSNQISDESQVTTISGASSTSTTTYGYDAYGVRTELTTQGGPHPGTFGYGYDAQGNTSLLVGQGGTDGNNVVATYGYDPYGNPDGALTTGDAEKITSLNKSGAVINPFRFSGRFTDPGSNTVDMGVRRWGPSTMHFLEEDEYAGSLDDLSLTTDPLSDNRYALAGANPINFVEEDGHRARRLPVACAPYRARVCAKLLARAVALARPYIERQAISDGHYAFDPFTGGLTILASVRDIERGLTKLSSKRGAALRVGALRGAATQDFIRGGRLAKLARPFARVLGPIAIVGGFVLDFISNEKHMDKWDAAIQASFTTGGAVAGGALGSAACAADTFVTAGLGSAACPLLVGAGILSGQWVGGELGTGARWLRHNISSLWTSGPAQRIAPGPIGEWRYDPNAVA